MHILNASQVNTISGGNNTDACYEAYKKVTNDNYDFSIHLLTSDQFGVESAVAYKFGLKNAIESICGDSFEEVEAIYCANQPATCLNYKYKK